MDLIEKEKLIEILAEMQGRCATKAALVQNSKIWQQVKDMPAVDAKPVRHGRWITNFETDEGRSLRCSKCRMVFWVGHGRDGNYCPNCGARMDERSEE